MLAKDVGLLLWGHRLRYIENSYIRLRQQWWQVTQSLIHLHTFSSDQGKKFQHPLYKIMCVPVIIMYFFTPSVHYETINSSILNYACLQNTVCWHQINSKFCHSKNFLQSSAVRVTAVTVTVGYSDSFGNTRLISTTSMSDAVTN